MPTPLPAANVPSRQPLAQPLTITDVYIEDICNLVQGSRRQRRIARRILFHTIDEILRPLDPMHPHHQEPISIKKLLKGDHGCWSTTKLLLGWIIDSVNQTLTLPAHRYERLCTIFNDLRVPSVSR
jgi:valyl-tRNA synthetase